MPPSRTRTELGSRPPGPSAPQGRRPRSRRLVLRLAVVLGSASLALLTAELVTRLIASGPVFYHDSQSLHYFPGLGFRERPDHEGTNRDEFGPYSVRINSQGFRGPELPAPGTEKPSGVERICFIGDSFLKGYVVRDEHLMTRVAEEAIAERGGAGVEVYGLACSDYGTAQELLLLREHGGRIRPDSVVLVMYPHNDVANNGLPLAGRTSVSMGDYLRPYLVPDGGGGFDRTHMHPVRAFLRRHLLSFRRLERRLMVFGELHEIPFLRPYGDPKAEPLPDRLSRGLPPGRTLELFRRSAPGSRWEESWRVTEALLAAFRDEVRELGARFLLLVVPDRIQVERFGPLLSLEATCRAYGDHDVDELLDLNYPEERLAAFCERGGIEARFLLDPLRRAAFEDQPLYATDAHLAWRGHRIAGLEAAAWHLGEPSPGDAARIATERPTPLTWPAAKAFRLDFRTGEHLAHLASRWSRRRDRTRGCKDPGWPLDGRERLVVPVRLGVLVARGYLSEDAPVPTEVTLSVLQGGRETVVLEHTGPFEISLSRNQLLGALRTRTDHLVATLELELHGAGPRVPAILHEVELDESGNREWIERMVQALGRKDRDGDGAIAPEEIPADLVPLLERFGLDASLPATAEEIVHAVLRHFPSAPR